MKEKEKKLRKETRIFRRSGEVENEKLRKERERKRKQKMRI